MSHFVLEIGTEELPARFLNSVEKELQERFTTILSEEMLTFDSIETHSTPRRSILHIHGLPMKQEVREELVLGPSIKIAYDDSGTLTKAAIGFAKGQGVDVADIFVQKTDKGEYIAVHKKVGAKSTLDVLAQICPTIIQALPFPKRMRWGDGSFAYARPMHWILAMFDTEQVSFTVGLVQSGNETSGHRILGKGPWKISHANELESVLKEKAKVFTSPSVRRKLIIEEGNKLAGTGRILWKDSLLDEVQGLVEYPVPLLASFHQDFLKLPREVLLTSMESHQKSFGVEDSNANLLPYFLTVLNIESTDIGTVKKGWERVLRARLEDARFYWETDLKSGFDVWLPMLDNVIFLGPLGSMGDKCRRLESLCAWLATQIKVDEKTAAKAGRISKADLVSQMVGEFDTLQGIMGGIYAKDASLSDDIAKALQEQYLPAGPDTPIPSSDFGAILSMADKADTLIGCFGIGKIPTGTADPYALRRCALGIARIILEKGYRISVTEFFEKAFSFYSQDIKWKFEKAEMLKKLNEFFVLRLKNSFVADHETLLVEACLVAGFDDVWAVGQRIIALDVESKKTDFVLNVQTFKRVSNIVRKEVLSGQWKDSLLQADVEKELAKAIQSFEKDFKKLWNEDKFGELFALMNTLRPKIDAFFDGVMVMDENLDVRENRLNLLFAIISSMGKLADFSVLQI